MTMPTPFDCARSPSLCRAFREVRFHLHHPRHPQEMPWAPHQEIRRAARWMSVVAGLRHCASLTTTLALETVAVRRHQPPQRVPGAAPRRHRRLQQQHHCILACGTQRTINSGRTSAQTGTQRLFAHRRDAGRCWSEIQLRQNSVTVK